MSRNWISFPLREGECSRQAHCDFPEGTYEREMGREGFFGPTAHLHHKHPPTGWIDWQGPLRPHAFNFKKPFDANGEPTELDRGLLERRMQANASNSG